MYEISKTVPDKAISIQDFFTLKELSEIKEIAEDESRKENL